MYKSDSKPLVIDNNVKRWKNPFQMYSTLLTFLLKRQKPLFSKYALNRPVQGAVSLMFHGLCCEIRGIFALFHVKSLLI